LSDSKTPLIIPVLPLRDVVVYPHMVIPLFVGREKSIKALDKAMEGETKQILLTAQKDAVQDDPTALDIYSTGTLSNILQMLKLPDGTIKVLVEGTQRGRVIDFTETDPFFIASVEAIKTIIPEDMEQEGLLRSLLAQFDQYIKLDKKMPGEILISLSGIEDPVRMVDTIAAHMPLKMLDKQKILETENFRERIEQLMRLIEVELDLLQVERRISGNVKKQIEKKQREYYLTEKMQAIQKELGDLGEEGGGKVNEIVALMEKIEKAGMSKEAKEKALSEINKLKMMPPMSAEATVSRNYIDWFLAVPWKKRSKVRNNLIEAEAILNEEHYGLEKVKERILEYLAVQQRVKKVGGPILCLVGPPGVGKTSLGQSIARATSREFVRMSLGGVRDEAEIRGHRRTYIGALPGKILQKLAKVGVKNPLFLLDEVDKMAMDFRGDPASALLEVLDPEQNNTFNDHYLEVDYDLSDVMFVTTANSLNIPLPLLDRMEVIRLSGYTEDEKMNIAIKYLIPKQMKETGLLPAEVNFKDEAILDIIRYYTREAGVRSLEREISKVCRKIIKDLLLSKKAKSKIITRADVKSSTLEKYLGVRKYRFGQVETYDQVGQVTGLAWTEVGGELLTIEAVAVPGKGKVTSTGKLGEVMQESIQAAMTVVRSRAKGLGIPMDFYEKQDIHIHVPEGATPKDGPSAGIGMCVALVSMLTNIPVRKDVAMTGEITLRGQILPIGGLKEKLLAARRAGITDVIIPDENLREMKEISEEVYRGMHIHPVRWIDEVLQLALLRMPLPLVETEEGEGEGSGTETDGIVSKTGILGRKSLTTSKGDKKRKSDPQIRRH
jgi:ATP-dependent Lon protease